MILSSPVSKLPRVGTVYQKKLEDLGIKTVGDILYYFPYRYEYFPKATSINSLCVGERHTVSGEIIDVSTGKAPRRRIFFTEILLQDQSGAIKAIWFNQPYLAKKFKKKEKLILSGKVSYSRNGPQFINPLYKREGEGLADQEGHIVSVYPETKGLSSRWLCFLLRPLMQNIDNLVQETLPAEVIKEKNLCPLSEALREIHFPSSLDSAKKAQKRISFERIFLLQLLLLKKKMFLARHKSVPVPISLEEIQDLVSALPFSLTDAQKKSAWQILKDMEKPIPMNRLLEGDVGSGKTVIAIIAALAAIKAGYQVAFMAPTEILARQHFDETAKLLWRFKIDVGLLTGKRDKLRSKKLKGDILEVSREKLIEKVRNGEVDVLIGTHSLITEKTKFKNLALIILDEQHRFGVSQRAKLCLKKTDGIPHLLSMTATPIPRTLALAVYGDLDLSLIDEMPLKRKKVITKLITPSGKKEAYQLIRKELEGGRQAFFVCRRIEKEEEKDSAWAKTKTVEEEKEKLAKQIFPEFKVEMLHGKMKTMEKEKIMQDFKRKKIDVLVSTSVVEVGIDIPNATVMAIEGVEMFGLAQLHQFRGRVGRGEFQSYCFLFTSYPGIKTKKRLQALLRAKSGFELAEKDLEIRGPGDFLGKRQWGVGDFTMNTLKDHRLVENAREAAKKLLENDPELKKYPLLKKRVGGLEKKLHME